MVNVLGSCNYWFRTLIVAREAKCMRRVRDVDIIIVHAND
jgi:hypothetical protein